MAILQTYENDQYQEPSRIYNSSATTVDDNDTMTSYHLAQGHSVIFYFDVDYQREMFRVPSAEYGFDCPGVRPEHNDQMSSFRLYSDLHFGNQI